MKRDGPRANFVWLYQISHQVQYSCFVYYCKVYNYKTDKYIFLIKAAYQFLPDVKLKCLSKIANVRILSLQSNKTSFLYC